MRPILATSSAVLFLLAACASTKVYIDYEEGVDFNAFKTFKFRDSPDDSMSKTAPLIHERIVRSIETQFQEIGLQKVDSDPDLFVTYYTSTRQEFRADTTHYGYGYPSRWYRYGYYGGSMGSSTTRVTSYDVGTLVIDVWDPDDDELVWRGVAQDTVPSSPEKLSNKIDKAIARMIKQSEEKM